MLLAILLFCSGLLASAAFVVKRKPNAQTLLNILSPFQGIIGITILIFGLMEAFQALVYLRLILLLPGFWKFIYFSTIIVSVLLGAVQGFSMLSWVLFRGNEEKKAKAEKIRNALIKVQIPLGLFAMVISALFLILNFTSAAV